MNKFIQAIKKIFFSSYTPNWIILLIDAGFSLTALLGAVLISVDFRVETLDVGVIIGALSVMFIVRIFSFVVGKTYSSIIRFTGATDVLRLFLVITIGGAVLIGLNFLSLLIFGKPFVSFSLLIIENVLLLSFTIISRIVMRAFYSKYINLVSKRENVIIYGSGERGIVVKNALDNMPNSSYNILAFIDEHVNRKVIEGVKIYHPSKIKSIYDDDIVDKLIIARSIKDFKLKNDIIEFCISKKIEVLEVPKFERWVTGKLSVKQIKPIKIESLLERGEIVIDEDNLRKQLLNKTVLVTGAAGSIGSEIVRQVIKFNPQLVVLFDQAESPLYDIELEIKEEIKFLNFKIEIGDIQDKERLEDVFSKYRPDVVYHAAAYKHVPMIEMHPIEGIKTNVFGTKNVADLSDKYQVDKFVMISTDKAVNPTNVMGATKRISEIYIQSLNNQSKTCFITTRFGNVLGSNGSVIPRFKKQIEEGGPLTVTHPDIVRFFMTIPEACRLVLQAGEIGRGGEIFVFDMGESVKIVDLAKNMIRLSGFEVGKDIDIIFTGLRSGEKLYEETLSSKETVLPTTHNKINIAKVRKYHYKDVLDALDKLSIVIKDKNINEAVREMKYIVPEFKSKNSSFEEVDFQIEQDEKDDKTRFLNPCE